MIKLVGGGAVGVVAVSVMQGETPFLQEDTGTVLGLLRDGAIVALAANLGNLFDRAPGRATKFTAVAFVALALVARSSVLFVPAVAIGAGLGLLVPDLRERAMLGDAGANPLGAVCGVAALWAVPDPRARWAVLVVVGGLNLLSEVVSFSTLIDSVGPLRWFDRLGSLRGRSVADG
jgi:UDP-N-acetylmuramyl pentapeptide phosphotransferase/UDP-N-acetylglucosamine-1-phosphate transferase